jgi:pyruvate dehydrogenase E2 component (dihydrolipoamide acetyltransferase)
MATDFRLPDVGEGVAEGELVAWLVDVGDTVEEDQPVAEVETDKAVVDVPSPYDGTVAELHWTEGDVVPVGDIFITYNVAGDDEAVEGATAEPEPGTEPESGAEAVGTDAVDAEAGDADAGEAPEPTAGRTFAPPSVRRLARELGVDLAAVEGSGPSGRVTEGDVRRHAEGSEREAEAAEDDAAEPGMAEPEPAESEATQAVTRAGADGAADEPAAVPQAAADRETTLATPATRKVAADLGVDIDAVPVVEERDGEAFVTADAVREFAEAGTQPAAAEAPTEVAEPPTKATTGAPAGGERETEIPYRGVRRTIGKKMEESMYSAPHVTHHDSTAIPDLVEVRERLKPKAEEAGVKLTYMPFVLKALVAALKDHPELNAELREDEEVIVQKHYYNIGIAVATDAGLMVPVVKRVDEKSMLELAAEVNELAQKARDRSISVSEMQGGTFSVTNFGAIGGEYATPVINYPEVGILGLGAIEERPVVLDGEVVPRPTLPISVSIDHRVVDGADVAQFGNEVLEYLNNPELLLLE